MTLTANWSYPTAIRFGAGRIKEIGEACEQAGISRPLLVTDRGLASLPIVQLTLNLMSEAGLCSAVFSDVDANPNESNLAAGIEAFNSGGHDGVIAFGGGYPIVEGGAVIGAIGVSGGHYSDDMEVARAGLAAIGAPVA